MGLKILTAIERNSDLKASFLAFLKRRGDLQVWDFVKRPDVSGDLYEKYFAPKPEIDVKLPAKLYNAAQAIIKSRDQGRADRLKALETKIAQTRGRISEAMIERGKLEKEDKKSKSKKHAKTIAKLNVQIKQDSALTKGLTKDRDALQSEKYGAQNNKEFAKFMKDAVTGARTYLEGEAYKAFLRSNEYKVLRSHLETYANRP